MGRFAEGFSIKVVRTELLETLKKNRETHAEEYESAKKAYPGVVRQALLERAEAIENGSIKPSEFVRFDLPQPRSYVEAYDEMIDMLSMDVRETLEISSSQYRAWVKDDWSWKEQYRMSVSNYV